MQGYSKDNQELKPMVYSSAGIKRLHFKKGPDCNCIRIHWHEHMELLRVHEGEMWINDGINTQKLSAGELYIIPPKSPHKGYTLNCGVDYDVLVFDVRYFYNNSELCNTYLPAIFDGRAKFKTITSDKPTIQYFDKIYAKLNKTGWKYLRDVEANINNPSQYERLRNAGVRTAWRYERESIKLGGRGSENWTRAERAQILQRKMRLLVINTMM